MHLVNLIEQLHRKYYPSNGKHEARDFRTARSRGLNQRGWCLAPNSLMISARVHAGLTYYLRRIGRCAAPLSPLIETIVCRSAVDSRSGVQPISPPPPLHSSLSLSLSYLHTRVSQHVDATQSTFCIFATALRLIDDLDEARSPRIALRGCDTKKRGKSTIQNELQAA